MSPPVGKPRFRWMGALLPFIVWMLYFTIVYAVHSIGCIGGWNDAAGADVVRLSLLVLTGVALLATGMPAWLAYRALRGAGSGAEPGRTTLPATLTILAAVVAVVATLWVALPIALVPPCQ